MACSTDRVRGLRSASIVPSDGLAIPGWHDHPDSCGAPSTSAVCVQLHETLDGETLKKGEWGREKSGSHRRRKSLTVGIRQQEHRSRRNDELPPIRPESIAAPSGLLSSHRLSPPHCLVHMRDQSGRSRSDAQVGQQAVGRGCRGIGTGLRAICLHHLHELAEHGGLIRRRRCAGRIGRCRAGCRRRQARCIGCR